MLNLLFRLSPWFLVTVSSCFTVPPLVVFCFCDCDPTMIGLTCFVLFCFVFYSPFILCLCLLVHPITLRLPFCTPSQSSYFHSELNGRGAWRGTWVRTDKSSFSLKGFNWPTWPFNVDQPLTGCCSCLISCCDDAVILHNLWNSCSLRSQNKLGSALLLIVLCLMWHCEFQWFIVPDKYSLISRHCPWYSCSHFQFTL